MNFLEFSTRIEEKNAKECVKAYTDLYRNAIDTIEISKLNGSLTILDEAKKIIQDFKEFKNVPFSEFVNKLEDAIQANSPEMIEKYKNHKRLEVERFHIKKSKKRIQSEEIWPHENLNEDLKDTLCIDFQRVKLNDENGQ